MLGASLILNLFLGGLVVASLVRQQQQPKFKSPLEMIESRLPAEDAKVFDEAIRSGDIGSYGKMESRLLMARQGVAQALAAEPFDPDALTRALDVWRVEWPAFVGNFTKVFVHSLTKISPEGRRALVTDSGLNVLTPPQLKQH